MVGSALSIISLIEDGVKQAEVWQLTVNPEEMLRSTDRNSLSYISRQSVIDSGVAPAEIEIARNGLYDRGAEDITKLGATIKDGVLTNAGPNILPEAIYDQAKFESQSPKVILYVMRHFIVNGKSYHTTTSLHTFIPGSCQYISTGPGHLQKDKMDIKKAKDIEFVQILAAPKDTIVQYVKPGSWGVAYPNYSDYIIFLGAGTFVDKSIGIFGITPRVFDLRVPYVAVNINGRPVLVSTERSELPVAFWNHTSSQPLAVGLPANDLYSQFDNEKDLKNMFSSEGERMPILRNEEYRGQVARAARTINIIESGAPVILEPRMDEKPWGSQVPGISEPIGEYWYSSPERGKKLNNEQAVPETRFMESRITIPGISEPVGLAELIATNPQAVLGAGVVTAFGMKPLLLKYLTPGQTPRKSWLSFQVHPKKDEIWIVANTTVPNPKIIRGWNKDLVAKFMSENNNDANKAKAAFMEVYEKALAEYSLALDAFIEAFKQVESEENLKGKNLLNYYEEKYQNTDQSANYPDLASKFIGLMESEERINSFYNFMSVKKGDIIPIPAHTVHALLEGVEVIEPQIEGETYAISDSARFPVRYKIETKDGRVVSLKGDAIQKVFDAIDLVSSPSPFRVISNNNGVEVKELGVYDGLTVNSIELEKGANYTDTTEEGYHILTISKGEVTIKTKGGEITVKAPENPQEKPKPVLIPASAGKYEVVSAADDTVVVKSVALPTTFVSESEMLSMSYAKIKMVETGHIRDFKNTLTSPDMKAMIKVLKDSDGYIINAFDSNIEDANGAVQMAQRLIDVTSDGRVINIRGFTGMDLIREIEKIRNSEKYRGKIRATITTAPNMDQKVLAEAMKFGNVINVDQMKDGKGRYMPVPGLQDLALRIALANILYKDPATSGYTADGVNFVKDALNRIALAPDNKPFTKDDVIKQLMSGFFKILPKIVPVDLAAAREAYKAAQLVLKSL